MHSPLPAAVFESALSEAAGAAARQLLDGFRLASMGSFALWEPSMQLLASISHKNQVEE